MLNEVDRLVDEYDALEYKRKRYVTERQQPTTNARLRQIIAVLDRIVERQREIGKRLYQLEDCEHANVEDTGGPDGSQVCMDCGKVR
jgi:hypothetical protein